MSVILSGLLGVLSHINDVLIFGLNQAEHDVRLANVLTRIQEAGVTFNASKREFSVPTTKFLGHVIDAKGIQADPGQLAASRDLEYPTNVSEIQRFMGMVNQLGKYSPNIAEISQPLRELLRSKRS